MLLKHKRTSGISRRDVLKYGLYGGLTAGLGGSLLLGGCRSHKPLSRPNILLITLDTTRVDHLGCYGYDRMTSPNLDKLASESVVYTNAISSSSWTLPSHASLFTGKFTTSHGAHYDPDGPLRLTDGIAGPRSWGEYRARGLSPDEHTLAQLLSEAGYVTGAFVGGPWLMKPFGLDKGFSYYDDDQISSINGRLANQITPAAKGWVEKHRKDSFFLFLNYFDAHAPYQPPDKYKCAFLPKDTNFNRKRYFKEEVVGFYDGEILFMDEYIGILLNYLKETGLYDKTWIIVTADHGELFGEHGHTDHGFYLYQGEIHVPLFIKYPAGEVLPSRSDLLVQQIDIFPLICQRLGLNEPGSIQGSAPPPARHPIIAETYPLKFATDNGHWRAIFEDGYKFLWNSLGQHALYNLANDPRETSNLLHKESHRADQMLSKMNGYLETLPKPGKAAPTQELDDETKKALKSLGYVN